jgi:glycosyltransferase involved in cell wall biosynthesis
MERNGLSKIVHISTNNIGGAGGASYRIHKQMLEQGFDSTLLVKHNALIDNTIITYPYYSLFDKICVKFSNFFQYLFVNSKYLFLSTADKPSKRKQNWLKKYIPSDIDIVIIHWVAGFITLEDLVESIDLNRTRVYIMMMDMAPLTGGCHYSFGCSDYSRECHSCPATNSSYFHTKIKERFFNNAMALKQLKSSIISWTHIGLEQARESAIPFYDYKLIKPPLDLKLFTYSKKENQAGTTNKVILMGAYNKNDERKGYLTFVLAINCLSDYLCNHDIKLTILVPNIDNFHELNTPNVDVQVYEFASNLHDLSSLYKRADLFVNTSLDDSGPLMLIEAMFCGIPVIATKTGVAIELLAGYPNVGRLVSILSHKELAESIKDCLYGDNPISPGKNIEEHIEKHYENVMELQDMLLENNR